MNWVLDGSKPNLYLAAPLHQATQRQYLDSLAARLAEFYNVYLPHRDGGLYFDMLREPERRPMVEIARDVRAADLAALNIADMVLAVVFNAHFKDCGSAFEMGFAVAREIPIYALAPDMLINQAVNPMLLASFTQIFKRWEDVLPIVEKPSQQLPLEPQ